MSLEYGKIVSLNSPMMDTHCHLDFAEFDGVREQLLMDAAQLTVKRILVPGVKAATWQDLIALCQSHPALDFALGLHPYFLADYQAEHMALLQQLAEQYQPLAIGEVGLDAMVDVPMALQLNVLRQQIEIAKTAKLPLILHQRKTASSLLAELKHFPYGGVLHAFSGSYEQGMAFIDKGFKLGIGGVITYPRAAKTRASVARFPLEALMLETDGPDMPIANQTTNVNSPLNLPFIFNALAELRDEPPAQLAKGLWQNSQAVFGRGKI
ncbi:TatD family hydrolase [Motilimonas cestriensis]